MMLEEFRKIRSELMSRTPDRNEPVLINLAVCGEECSELSKACFEMIRLLSKDESLRKGAYVLKESLNEEVADVIQCLCNLYDAGLIDETAVIAYFKAKCNRYESGVNGVRKSEIDLYSGLEVAKFG